MIAASTAPSGDEADPDPAAWLGKLTGDPTEVLRGGLWIARLLQTKYHHTRRALEAGTLRLSQAKVLVRAAERAPKALTREQVASAEESLVLTATGESSPTNTKGRPMTAARLRDEARRVFANMLPTKAEADAAEGDDARRRGGRRGPGVLPLASTTGVTGPSAGRS